MLLYKLKDKVLCGFYFRIIDGDDCKKFTRFEKVLFFLDTRLLKKKKIIFSDIFPVFSVPDYE